MPSGSINKRAGAAHAAARHSPETKVVSPSRGVKELLKTKYGRRLLSHFLRIGFDFQRAGEWWSYYFLVRSPDFEKRWRARANMLYPPLLPMEAGRVMVEKAYGPKFPSGMRPLYSVYCGVIRGESPATPQFGNHCSRWCRRGSKTMLPGDTSGTATLHQRWGDCATMVASVLRTEGEEHLLFLLMKSFMLISDERDSRMISGKILTDKKNMAYEKKHIVRLEWALVNGETDSSAATELIHFLSYTPSILWDEIWTIMVANADISQRSLGIPAHIFLIGILFTTIVPFDENIVRFMVERSLSRFEGISPKKLAECYTIKDAANAVLEHLANCGALGTFKNLVQTYLFVKGYKANPRMPFTAFETLLGGIKKIVSETNSFAELMDLVCGEGGHPIGKAEDPDIIFASVALRYLNDKGKKQQRTTLDYGAFSTYVCPDDLEKVVAENLAREKVREEREEAAAAEAAVKKAEEEAEMQRQIEALAAAGPTLLPISVTEPGNVSYASREGDKPWTDLMFMHPYHFVDILVGYVKSGNVAAITRTVAHARRVHKSDKFVLRCLAEAVAKAGCVTVEVPVPDGSRTVTHSISKLLNLGNRGDSATGRIDPRAAPRADQLHRLEEDRAWDAAAAAAPGAVSWKEEPEESETALRWEAFKAERMVRHRKELEEALVFAASLFECGVCLEECPMGDHNKKKCGNTHPPSLCAGCSSALETCPFCRGEFTL